MWAYGSRVNGRSHTGSDLDLVLRGPGLEKTPTEQLADFTDAVRESTIPFLIQAQDWARLPQSFHLEIERDHVALGTPTGRLLDGKWCWPRVQLGAVTELLTGFPFKSEQYTDDHHAPRLLRGDNVAQGTLRWSGAKRWAANATRVDAGYWLQEGDVVLAMDRPWIEAGLKYASVRRADLPALLVQWVARLRGSERLHTRFLHYVIGSRDFTQYVTSVQTGTAVPHISARQIKDFAFRLPSLSEQRAIVNILGTLDDKIELNRRMNETLEAIARALFKSWFVDFEPVRAKMEGRNTGLPVDVADLFPDTLDYKRKPQGWPLRTLAALVHVNPESWSSGGAPDYVEYVDLANTKWGTIETTQRFLWHEAPSRARRILRPGDTIVGTVRPGNGSFAFIAVTGLTGSTGFAVLRPHKRRDAAFVFLSATAPENVERLAHLADGAAYPAVRPQVVAATQATVPSDGVMEMFSGVASSVLNRIESNKAENHTLAQIRDHLLPKLISGEIRVPQAEQVLEKAL